MATDYVAAPHTWVASGHGLGDTADGLASAVDTLCYAIGDAGECWGNDDIGRAFFNGDDQNAGFGKSRDALLESLKDIVNLVRATGGSLIVAGQTFQLAEEASTIGSKLPKGADKGALAKDDPYPLPTVVQGFPDSDPAPTGFEWILNFLEVLVGGVQWPDGNMDKLAALRDAFHTAARAVKTAAEEVGDHAKNVTDNNAGDAVDKFATFADALRGGGEQGGLLWLSAQCQWLGDSVDFLIRQKNAARLQFQRSLEFLLATWAIAWGISWITGGASVAGATATTEAEGFVLKSFLQNIAKAVLQGMWYGAGMDAVGQWSRIQEGVQKDGFHYGELFTAMGEGGLAGGVMGAAGGAVAARSTALTRAMADFMGASGIKGGAARFLFNGVTGTGGNLASQLAFEHHMNVGQAAGFGFGMAGMGAFGEAGKHFAGKFGWPGHPAGAPGGGDDSGGTIYGDIPNTRNDYPHFSDRGVGYHIDHEGQAGAPPHTGGERDGGQTYGGGQPHDGGQTNGNGQNGGAFTPRNDYNYRSDTGVGFHIKGEVISHGTPAGPAGHPGQADLATMGRPDNATNAPPSPPAAGSGHPTGSGAAPVSSPATQPTVFVAPGDGGAGAGGTHGLGGTPAGGLEPGASANRPVLPPGASASRPVLPPGESASRPVLPPGESASRPVLPPGESASRPVLPPGESASRPVPPPDGSASRPVIPPGEGGTAAGGVRSGDLTTQRGDRQGVVGILGGDTSTSPREAGSPVGATGRSGTESGRPPEAGRPGAESGRSSDPSAGTTRPNPESSKGPTGSRPTAEPRGEGKDGETVQPSEEPSGTEEGGPSRIERLLNPTHDETQPSMGQETPNNAEHQEEAGPAGHPAPDPTAASDAQGPHTSHPTGTPGGEATAGPHPEVTAQVHRLTDSLRRDVGALEDRVAAHEAQAREAGAKAEAALKDSLNALAEGGHDARERSDRALAESKAALRDQAHHRDMATSYRNTLNKAREAQIGYDALRNSLEHLATHEHPSEFEAQVAADAARRLAEDAQKRLTAYDDARSEMPSPAEEPPATRPDLPEPAGAHDGAREPTGESSEHGGPSEPTAPRTETGGEEPVPEPRPEIHPPRYTDYGALGDGTAVEGARLPADPAEAARQWAAHLPEHLPAKLRAEVEARVRDILSDPDPDRWTDLLQDGIAFESRGHVVWIKPTLDAYTHVETPAGPRRYTVSFGGSGAGAKESGRVHRDESGGVVEMLDNSDGLERVSLPGPSVGKVSGHAHGSSTEVMAGHKSVAFKHDHFDWTVRLETHVNGAEHGHGGVVHDLSLRVPFPEQFHREGPHVDAGDRPPTPRHRVTSDRAPEVRKHDVVVTAVQRDQLVTEFQRRALQAGMSPKRIAEIVNRDLNGHLGQQVLLNRSRDLLNGELTTPDTTVRSRVLRLERLPESDTPIRDAVLRDDQGLLTTTNDSHQFGHKWGVNFGLKLGMDNPAAKFFARIGGNYQGGKNHVVSYSHTTLPKITLVRKAEVARYHAIVRMEVDTRFGSFPVDVPMELAVRAGDAHRFETDLLGGVKTEGLLPPGSGEHAVDPRSQEPSRTGDPAAEGQGPPAHERPAGEHEAPGHSEGEGRTAHPDGDPAAAPGHGLPVHAENPVPVAPHEPHPAEPAHLAAGRGAGMGKLTGLPGADRVVTDLRAAIDKALPDLPEPVRRRLAQNLDARFGRSALEGRSLADLLHGDTHTIKVGRHTIEIAHRAQLGERRNVEEFDMTVNDRKVAGSGTAVGQNRHSGGGVEVAGNVRVQAGKVGVDAPKLALHAGGSKSKSVTFLGGNTEYRRTETDGPVTQVTKEMQHHVRMRVHDGRKEVTDHSWTVSGDDVSARVVVPQEHTPAAKVTPDEVAKVGQVDRVDTLPDDNIDFAGQTTAVFPSFSASHDLPFEVARVEAEANGRPAPTDFMDIPPEILDATRPSTLEAHFAELTSRDGWRIQVTQPDGSTRGMTLRATFGTPEHATARTGVEIEHYRAANSRMKDATSTDLRAEGELKFGGRGKVTMGGVEAKVVGEVGGMAEVDRRTGGSEYTGASDVIRGTYSSDGLTHSFSGSDVHLSVTPDAPAGHHPQTVHLRVHDGADFMMPDRIAQDHHLATAPDVHGQDGEPVVPKPVGEPRTYRPDLAITSAHVERFDGREVLPKVESMLESRGLLPENGPGREMLRNAFGEPALAANMASLRRGVVQWYPVESAYGFTRHVGVRVRAELDGGAHTAERPDVSHMARVQGLSGSETSHGHGSGHGLKGLVRGMAEGEKGSSGGGQIGGARAHRSETEHGDGTGVKDIDRRQTREGSQEFTHGLKYEIEIVETKDPPHGLEHGINAIRRGADAVTRVTHNDAASRYFDRLRSAGTETATVEGSVRLVVPHHLTTVAGEGEHVGGWAPVSGQFPRWQAHTRPTEVNGTLGDMVGRISFPGAEIVHEYAPLAALPPERRGPTPADTDRPSGFELSRPQGMKLWKQTEPATMLSQVKSLLDHSYTVDGLRPGEKITVGMNVTALREDAQALLKRREYSQTATSQRDGGVHGTDSSVRGGGSVGSSGGHGLMVSHGQGKGSAVAHEADSVNIRERNIEVTDQNIMFGADVVMVFHREGAPDLLVDVADALHIRLTADDAAELERRHPGLIRRPAVIENPPPTVPGFPTAPVGEPEPVERPQEGE